ncbi:MAG TPA: hypothetical protein PLZ78_08980 [Spirochaetota bacterium]|nr:hypothetical protein [Spirochaetota bacterium]
MNIKELREKKVSDMQWGDNVNVVAGKVVSTEPMMTKASKDGKQYTQQKARLADASGEITATFYKHEDMSKYVGQQISIVAAPWKNYTRGISLKSYEGHNYLNINEYATITTGLPMEPDDSDFPPIEEYTKEQKPAPAPVAAKPVPAAAPAPAFNGNGSKDTMMMTAYAKDLTIAYLSSGLEPHEAVSKAIAQVQFIHDEIGKFLSKTA